MIVHSRYWAAHLQQQQQQRSGAAVLESGAKEKERDDSESVDAKESRGYGFSVDFWALGTLAYEMLAGEAPFRDKNRKELYKKIVNGKIHFPSHLSPSAMSLIRELLIRDPEKRLGCRASASVVDGVTGSSEGHTRTRHGYKRNTGGSLMCGIDSLKCHPFFSGLDWELLHQRKIPPPIQLELSSATDYRYFDPDFVEEPISLDFNDAGGLCGEKKNGGVKGGNAACGNKKQPPKIVPVQPAPVKQQQSPSEDVQKGVDKCMDYGLSPILAGLKMKGKDDAPPELDLGGDDSSEGNALSGKLSIAVSAPPSSPHDHIADFTWICSETESRILDSRVGLDRMEGNSSNAPRSQSGESERGIQGAVAVVQNSLLSLSPVQLEAIKSNKTLPSTPLPSAGFSDGGIEKNDGGFILGVVASTVNSGVVGTEKAQKSTGSKKVPAKHETRQHMDRQQQAQLQHEKGPTVEVVQLERGNLLKEPSISKSLDSSEVVALLSPDTNLLGWGVESIEEDVKSLAVLEFHRKVDLANREKRELERVRATEAQSQKEQPPEEQVTVSFPQVFPQHSVQKEKNAVVVSMAPKAGSWVAIASKKSPANLPPLDSPPFATLRDGSFSDSAIEATSDNRDTTAFMPSSLSGAAASVKPRTKGTWASLFSNSNRSMPPDQGDLVTAPVETQLPPSPRTLKLNASAEEWKPSWAQ